MLVEDGVVLGTGPHKYGSRNPLAKRLLEGFHSSVAALAASVAPRTILEIGCGEGYVTRTLVEATSAKIRTLDLSDSILEIARSNVTSPRVEFLKRSIYELEASDAAELVVCCEVLEHLQDPARGLERVLSVARPYCLVSVPREPVWRILNVTVHAHTGRTWWTPEMKGGWTILSRCAMRMRTRGLIGGGRARADRAAGARERGVARGERAAS